MQSRSSSNSISCISGNREDVVDANSADPSQQLQQMIRSQDLPIYHGPHDNSDDYNMHHRRRGIFMILDNSEFLVHEKRTGSEEEVKQLRQVFSTLGFEVRIEKNLSKKEVISIMEQVARENHTDCDCFGMAVLSHGDEGDMMIAYDGGYYIEKLYALFNGNACTTLRGKPKLFFFNACKGKKEDQVDSICTKTIVGSLGRAKGGTVSKPLLASTEKVVTSHVYADFLCAFSTWQGYKSYRHPIEGSLYVCYLCEELLSGAGKGDDLTIILARVSRRMAESPAMEEKKILRQTSLYHSSLTKRIVLRPKKVVVNRS